MSKGVRNNIERDLPTLLVVDDRLGCILNFRRAIENTSWLTGDLSRLELQARDSGNLLSRLKNLHGMTRALADHPRLFSGERFVPLWVAETGTPPHSGVTPSSPEEVFRVLEESENALAFLDADFGDAGKAVTDLLTARLQGREHTLFGDALADVVQRSAVIGGLAFLDAFLFDPSGPSVREGNRYFVASSFYPPDPMRRHDRQVVNDPTALTSVYHACRMFVDGLDGWFGRITGTGVIAGPYKVRIDSVRGKLEATITGRGAETRKIDDQTTCTFLSLLVAASRSGSPLWDDEIETKILPIAKQSLRNCTTMYALNAHVARWLNRVVDRDAFVAKTPGSPSGWMFVRGVDSGPRSRQDAGTTISTSSADANPALHLEVAKEEFRKMDDELHPDTPTYNQ